MRLGYGLNLEQNQKLMMTPELRQAITILQLSAQELTTFIDRQLVENPLLELAEETGEIKIANSKKDKDGLEIGEETIEGEATGSDQGLNWQEYFNTMDDDLKPECETAGRKGMDPFVISTPTLQEYLYEQISIQNIVGNRELRHLLEYIIGNLDECGYLTISLEEIASDQKVAFNEVQAALEVVQSLEPAGVGARSLKECLLLQLHLLPEYPPQMPEFLDYLEDLAAGRIRKIAHALKLSDDRIRDLAMMLRKLDPKPGLRFSEHTEVRYIYPDVFVEEVDGEYRILINDTSIPRLRINQTYLRILNDEKCLEACKFVRDKLNLAGWLIRSIEKRRLTLYKLADAIVHSQKEFLRSGISGLKPLTLREIADEINVHESTVSRATANKYIETPRGIFSFKFFFATGFPQSGEVTSEEIKLVLKNIIAGEDSKNPYPDQKLAEFLNAKGINISRRTVAKYRDGLGLAAASARKR